MEGNDSRVNLSQKAVVCFGGGWKYLERLGCSLFTRDCRRKYLLTCEGKKDKSVREGDIWRWRMRRGELQRFPAPAPVEGSEKRYVGGFTLGLLSQTGAPDIGGGGGGGVGGPSLKLLLLQGVASSLGKRSSCDNS